MNTTSRQGMTLVELMIATALSAIILSAVLSTFIFTNRSAVRLVRYSDMEIATARGLELLGRELRMANSITTSGSPITQVSMVIPNPTGASTHSALYRFNSAARTFEREADGNTTVLIRDIRPDSFSFQRYDLNQSPAVNDHGTNQIQIAMTIAPATYGLVAATTKRVVSARFVLRNR